MEENLIEVKAILDEELVEDIKEDNLEDLMEFEKTLENEKKKEIRKSRLAKIREGLIRMGKVIVKGAIAAGAIVGLVSTLIPTLAVAEQIGQTLLSIGLVGQFADSGSKLMDTFKAGRAPVVCAG